MNALIRWTLPLVAYLCVGAVVTAALGYGYLRRAGKLDDDTMFRIVALLHGVDLAEIAKQGQKSTEETPAEEASFAEQQALVQAAALQFDAKQKQLADSLTDFDYQLKAVTEARQRYEQLRVVVENFLQQQQSEREDLSRAKVRAQLESLSPKKQAKPLLIKMIQDGQLDEVILLLNGMKDRARREILLTFDTPEDLDMLFQIQERMLTGDPAKPIIDAQLDALKQLKAEDE